MAKHRPLTCKEVETILKNLGFAPRPQKGTSHEQWVKDDSGKRYKVTVDCPKAPFTHDLIRSMAHQAGVSRKVFYADGEGVSFRLLSELTAIARRQAA